MLSLDYHLSTSSFFFSQRLSDTECAAQTFAAMNLAAVSQQYLSIKHSLTIASCTAQCDPYEGRHILPSVHVVPLWACVVKQSLASQLGFVASRTLTLYHTILVSQDMSEFTYKLHIDELLSCQNGCAECLMQMFNIQLCPRLSTPHTSLCRLVTQGTIKFLHHLTTLV